MPDVEPRESVGQSLIFAADQSHEYRNAADERAEFRLAVFDPIDGPAQR